MPHELDYNASTGRRAIFSVGETPWHREGIVIAEAPSFAEALRLSGTDYEVALRPLFITSNSGDAMQTPIGKAVVRTDRIAMEDSDILSIVGDGYTPLQNRDAFSVLEPLLDKGVAQLETGGSLRGGRDAWMMVKFNIDDPVVQEVFTDEVVPFGLITNNHSGTHRALALMTPIRVVCANTLGQALVNHKNRADVIGVAHRGNARIRMVEAAERLFGSITDRYHRIATHYKLMKETIMTVEEFTKTVMDVAAPLPPDLHTPDGQHLTSRGYDLAYAVAKKRRDAIAEKWENGIGHTGNHSAWEAYNAAVEVIDHDAELFRVRGSRVASMIAGRLVEKKTVILNSIAMHCMKAK